LKSTYVVRPLPVPQQKEQVGDGRKFRGPAKAAVLLIEPVPELLKGPGKDVCTRLFAV